MDGSGVFGEEARLSADYMKYWIYDYVGREFRVILQDGRTAAMPIDVDDPILKTEAAKTIFDWEKWWITTITRRGDPIISEAYSPRRPAPFNSRKSVYLDQNHWSTLALSVSEPSRVRESERKPAARIRELANDGGIVLPISSGTLTETRRLDRDLRYQLGLTIAQLAGGWQLRHPLEIRAHEFGAMFARRLALVEPRTASLPVVSLEPYSLLDDDVRAYKLMEDDPRLFQLAATGPTVLIELLLDPEKANGEVPGSWVRGTTEIGEAIQLYPKEERRPRAHMAAWADNSDAIHAALGELGLDPSVLAEIPATEIQKIMPTMPMVGLFTELMVRRHLEPNRRWRGNDLTDMMFLAAGAAYCDYVAAERATGNQLDQIQRSLGRPRNVHTTLESLVAHLDADNIQTATERALN